MSTSLIEKNTNEPAAGGSGRPKARGKALLAVSLFAALSFTAFMIMNAGSEETVTVNSVVMRIPAGTTYEQLREQGRLSARQGNLVAVDGSVLTQGAGRPFRIFEDGIEVTDLASPVRRDAVVTESDGEDVMEESECVERSLPGEVLFDSGSFNFYRGRLHLAVVDGAPDVTRTITGLDSGLVIHEVVSVPQTRVYSSWSSYTEADRKVVAFTFDDGPNPYYTPQVLDVLKENGVTATFFMLGSETDKYPAYALKVFDEGHMIASHTYSHKSSMYLDRIGYDATRDQLKKAADSIEAATGVRPRIVRPPGGYMNLNTILWGGDLADAYIGWTVDTKDFSKKTSVDDIVSNIMRNVKPGAIVLMHDGGGDRSKTVRALKIVLPRLKSQGYEFITVDELITIRKEEMQAGQ